MYFAGSVGGGCCCSRCSAGPRVVWDVWGPSRGMLQGRPQLPVMGIGGADLSADGLIGTRLGPLINNRHKAPES